MPFKDNPTIRPLYDQVDGGPPAAWKCLLEMTRSGKKEICGRVCSTLSGIISHQLQFHGIKPQMEIQYAEKQESD